MNGGPIGGVKQTGKWKIDARFNKTDLIKRCQRVAEYGSRITVSGMDGIEFIRSLNSNSTMYFIDPPYFEKGPSLYLNSVDSDYHLDLAKELRAMKDKAWVLTYDDCVEIRAMYSSWASIRPFSLNYAASEKRRGKEVLITPKWMELPAKQRSAAIGW